MQRIVIAGTGLSAWMAAAALTEALNREDYSVTLVGEHSVTSEFAPLGYADATFACDDLIRDALLLNESRIIADTGGSLTLGIALGGWTGMAATYFHPFSSIGASLGPLPFHQIAMKLRREGVPLKFGNYALAALAAQAGRFAEPVGNSHSVRSSCEHGLQVNCIGLTEFLRDEALASGAVHINEALQQVDRSDDGAIRSLTTKKGRRIDAELFLDCSGVSALLAGSSGAADWQDWSPWLPCGRVAVTTISSNDPPPAYSYAEANRGGWIRHLPLQGLTALAAYYDANTLNDRDALDLLQGSAPGSKLSDVHITTIRQGRRGQPWLRNCVALGMAATAIDPVGISNLQLLRSSINRLLALLPSGPESKAEAAEFNRQSGLQLDHARDFAMLHYKLNGRRGEAFWDACRDMPIPDSLRYRIELYESRGRVVHYDEEPLADTSWINLFDEHGVRPRHANPIADGVDSSTLRKHVDRVRAVMLEELGKMPTHADYLSRLGSSR
jgi:tryptophan halogenase